jgi:hypothetical protein
MNSFFSILSRIALMGFILGYVLGIFPALRDGFLATFLLINFFPALKSFFKKGKINLKEDWEAVIAGIALPFLVLSFFGKSLWWALLIIMLFGIIYFTKKGSLHFNKRK